MKNTDPILERINKIIDCGTCTMDDFGYSPNINYLSKYIKFNFEMTDSAYSLLKSAIKEVQLTTKQLEKLEKIAKGIMLLENINICDCEHIAEAIQYVCFDKS